MNSLMKTVAVSAMVIGSGFATMASANVATLTCGEFMAQEDDAARLETANSLLVWIADTSNFEAVGALERYKMTKADETASGTSTDDGWTDEEIVITIKAHCFHQPSDTNVIERLKSNS